MLQVSSIVLRILAVVLIVNTLIHVKPKRWAYGKDIYN